MTAPKSRKAKTGPKLESPSLKVAPVTLSLDEMTLRRLDVIGKGNASLGVRIAAREEYKRYQVRGTLSSPCDAPAAVPAQAEPPPA